MDQVIDNNNWEWVAAKWKKFHSKIKKAWNKLTDDELMEINGSREILAGKIQEKYNVSNEEANHQIDAWANQLKFK